MAKKKVVPVHVPLQTGFGFDVMDSTGNTPDFLADKEKVRAALDCIQQCKWGSIDVETTGLTDSSAPVALTPTEIKQGASNLVRMRTIQVRVPTVNGRKGTRESYVFDCDKMGPALTQEVATTILGLPLFIAHNAGFDLYWLRRASGRTVMPRMVADTMLLVRLLMPQLVLTRCELIKDIQSKHEVPFADEVTQAAWSSLSRGASGGSLADVVLALYGVVVDKSFQKPNNWTGLLGFGHRTYAEDDVIWADRIMCTLLNLEEDGDIYQAYMGLRARNANVRLVEPQVPELVELREHGQPLNKQIGQRYVIRKRAELAAKVGELIAIEPALEAYRSVLSNPDAGLDDALKKALATAFENRGVILRKTAATGAPQVGEKDLRACRAVQIEASRPLFNAWVAVCRSKKTSAMALDVVGFAERSDDGMLRSLLSHGPVTGRLAAAEPNCFTGDTEILTPDGWVPFDALQDDQLVCQYENGTLSFVMPHAHIRAHWEGNLVHNQTQSTDLLTTPGHRCLIQLNGAEQVVEAYNLPADGAQRHAARYTAPGTLKLSHRDMALLCLTLLGAKKPSVVPDEFACFVSTEPEAFFNQYFKEELLDEIRMQDGILRYLSKYTPSSIRLSHWLKSSEWTLSARIYDLDPVQLDYLAQCCLSLAATTNNTLTLHSEENAYWLQIALTLAGVTAQQDSQHPCKLYLKASPYSSLGTRTQTYVPYSGMVYCVSVESGFIVVRRNGKVMITGQCQQWPRDQLFRAMCMSALKDGCETLELVVTPVTQPLIAEALGHPVAIGESVKVDTAWLTALYHNDKLAVTATAETAPVLSKIKGKHVELDSVVSTEFSTYAGTLDGGNERKQFGNYLDECFTHEIVASDFGALDVRVGAALCIRSQREMLALAKGIPVPGPVQPPEHVVAVIKEVVALLDDEAAVVKLQKKMEFYKKRVTHLEGQLESLKSQLDEGLIQRKQFFKARGDVRAELLSHKLGHRLSQCLMIGAQRLEKEYSALRDAFVADIDIHTFTGMKLVGRDPMKEFEGLSVADRKALEKKLKKELGPRRQQGKIANLSLLYGMADAGFQEAAARGYDEHWTMQEAHDIRALWMDAYPEVELWHLWTECLQVGVVYMPEEGREKPARTGWWMARTLAGREIVACGLNAALSYQDQSSGADILALIMHRLKSEYPRIFDTTINQVHDELVLKFPRAHRKEYLEVVESVMVEEANSLTMPYGVPCAVSPACGPIWIKD